jgi:hypothetical protein
MIWQLFGQRRAPPRRRRRTHRLFREGEQSVGGEERRICWADTYSRDSGKKASIMEEVQGDARFQGKALMEECEIQSLFGHTFVPLAAVLQRAPDRAGEKALCRVGHWLPKDIVQALKPSFVQKAASVTVTSHISGAP